MVSSSSGNSSSSLFCTMMPYLGMNNSADPIAPTSTMYLKAQNERQYQKLCAWNSVCM